MHDLNEQSLHDKFLSPLCWKAKKESKRGYLIACGLSQVKQWMLKLPVSLKGPSHLWKLSRSSRVISGHPRGHPKRADDDSITREGLFVANATSVSGSACQYRAQVSSHPYPDLPSEALLTTFQKPEGFTWYIQEKQGTAWQNKYTIPRAK